LKTAGDHKGRPYDASGHSQNTVGAGFIPARLELQTTKNRLERFLTAVAGPEGILQDSKM
jgi:hypothetical protein